MEVKKSSASDVEVGGVAAVEINGDLVSLYAGADGSYSSGADVHWSYPGADGSYSGAAGKTGL